MARIRKSGISNKKWRIAPYLRLSREDGDDKESQSITSQRNLIDDYIIKNFDNNDILISKYYVDDGWSGTNFDRPEIKKLLDDIRCGIVNCIIVKDLSRFGRDYINVGHYLERVFPDLEVRFIAINDNIDSYKKDYDMLLPVKNVFNQQYAVDISNKVQSAFKAKQSKGEFIGAFPSYGYKKSNEDHNKLVIDEYPASIIRRIFELFIEGYGKIRIAKILNEEGILCPSEYKKQVGLNYKNSNKSDRTNYWTFSTVHRILMNEMYIGNMVQNKTVRRMKGRARYRPEDEWIIVEGTHDAIIDKSTWDKAQNLLSKNTRQLDFNDNIGLFAGFLKCADCGRAMAKNKRGGVIYYVCGTYKRYGVNLCASHTIRESMLENIVLEYLNLLILKTDKLREIAENQNKDIKNNKGINDEIEKSKISIKKILSLKKAIYEDYREGILTKDEYLEYKKDYEKEESFHKNKIATLNDQNQSIESTVLESNFVKRLRKYKRIRKLDRTILADFIDNIDIKENKEIIITLNCNKEIRDILDSTISADI